MGSSVLTLTSLPSVRDLAPGKDFLKFKNILYRVLAIWRLAKSTLPSALWQALDKDCFIFLYKFVVECPRSDTLQRTLCRVSSKDTRQRMFAFFPFFTKLFMVFSMLCRPTCSVLA
jgi:hypothetical protein